MLFYQCSSIIRQTPPVVFGKAPMGAVLCSWSSSVGWVRLESYSGTVSEKWRPDALPSQSPLCGKMYSWLWMNMHHPQTHSMCVWSSHIWVLYSEYSEYMYTQTLSKQKMMMLLQRVPWTDCVTMAMTGGFLDWKLIWWWYFSTNLFSAVFSSVPVSTAQY